jgi:hypothetical protein
VRDGGDDNRPANRPSWEELRYRRVAERRTGEHPVIDFDGDQEAAR